MYNYSVMYCPNNHGEFRDGFATCTDCGVPLVATPPTEPVNSDVPATTSATDLDDSNALDPDCRLVLVGEYSTFEAETVCARLEAFGIHSIVQSDSAGGWMPYIESAWRTRVLENERDLEPAQELLAASSEAEFTEPESAERPEKKFWRVQLAMCGYFFSWLQSWC